MVFECYSVLELLFKKQIGCQDDVLRRDQRDAEFVQDLLSVNCFKERDGRDIVEAVSEKTSHMGHDTGHIGLIQIIKRGPFLQDSPQDRVIIFHVRFLISGVRIAVEDSRPELTAERTDFEGSRIAEFGAIVGQDDWKQHTETVKAKALLQFVEHVDDGLRGVSLAKEQPHHPAGVELHRQQSFSAGTPDDAVHLHHGKILSERLKIGKSPSNAAFPVDLVLNSLSSPWLHHAGTRHVASFRTEEAGVDIAVHRFFSNRELIFLRFEDVMDGLSLLRSPMNQFAEEETFLLRNVRSDA